MMVILIRLYISGLFATNIYRFLILTTRTNVLIAAGKQTLNHQFDSIDSSQCFLAAMPSGFSSCV